jgi:hypothetical protein
VAAAHDVRRLGLVALVAQHQAQRRHRVQQQRDLAFLGRLLVEVEQGHAVARQRAAHRARLEELARRIADLAGGLGLPEAVADADAPGPLDLLDHFRD